MSKTIWVGMTAIGLAAGLSVSGCASTRSMFTDRSEIVSAPVVCAPMRFEVYFADSEARLTQPARQAIGMTAAQLQSCNIKSVRVIGLADARGGSSANLTLSERRAQTVAQALTGAGWPSPVFDVTAAGDDGAVNDQGVREPLRRRTEVLVEAGPRH